MSSESVSDDNVQQRHAQADELIRAINKNSIAVTALAAAVGALVLAVEANTTRLEEILEEDEDEDHDEDCDDDDCDGSCLDDPPRKRKKRR